MVMCIVHDDVRKDLQEEVAVWLSSKVKVSGQV